MERKDVAPISRSDARTRARNGDKLRPADKVERWPIDKLIPYARNARTHTDEQIGQTLNAGWDDELRRLELGELKLGGFAGRGPDATSYLRAVRKNQKREETYMFRNILIPTHGSDLAAKAVEQGVRFAKEIGAKITAVTVTEPFELVSVSQIQLEYTPIEYKKHAEAQANKVLGVVSAAAKSAGVVCDTLHVEHDQIYQAIIEAAGYRRCDLIVMASHGRRGVSAVVLGSETVKVLTHSKIPVLVYR